jgi:hypothetical protein
MAQISSRKNKSTFINVGNVLNKIVDKLGLDRRLREQALVSLWPCVAGETFAQKSRPLFVDYENNLVVSVRDAATAQELGFFKREIINKLKKLAQSTGIKIEGLRIDLKHYHQQETNEQRANASGEDILSGVGQNLFKRPGSIIKPDQASLDQIELSESELAELVQLQSNLEQNLTASGDLDDEQIGQLSQRISKIAAREIRLIKWQNTNGCPICSRCHLPASQLHTKLKLCPYCYLKQERQEP